LHAEPGVTATAAPGGRVSESESFIQKLKGRVADAAAGAVFKVATSNWNLAIPVVLFLVVGRCAYTTPETFSGPITVDFALPSEKAVPAYVPVGKIDENDIRWRFRYAETGTEFRAGVPYWIFRIMPRLMPEQFGGRGYDWFGFDDDDNEFYKSTPVPRGLALSDSTLRIPFLNVRFNLKRISVNCSGCHRGQLIDETGKRRLIDGMPNHTANLQAFKRFYGSAFQDPRFEGGRVVEAINQALAEDKKPALTKKEQLIYRALVEVLRQYTVERSGAWMDSRPDNGPGRIDPFNAVKFEVLKVPDDGTAPTLDFPAVWNQRRDMRLWHHYDGNTNDSSARNFGSAIGVGGIAWSVYKHSVSKVGEWLDILPPPKYPFAAPDPAQVAQGLELFKSRCAGCHGLYDREKNRIDTSSSPQYMQISDKIGTDPERWKAFPTAAAGALNRFGFEHGLWPRDAFRGSTNGYLCGPLDGVWARAPYLHNGSVPNLNELLKPPEQRPKRFYRGNPVYDAVNMGWVHTDNARKDNGLPLFEYDTSLVGNSNEGHPIAIEDDAERAAVLAYLKTL
jgi:hypothetical protein